MWSLEGLGFLLKEEILHHFAALKFVDRKIYGTPGGFKISSINRMSEFAICNVYRARGRGVVEVGVQGFGF